MTSGDEVGRLVSVITVDSHNLAEQMTAFYEVVNGEVALPTAASVVGATEEVVGFDIAEHDEELTATCHRGDAVQSLMRSDVAYAPDSPVGWNHAAYRRCLRFTPRGRRTGRVGAVLVVTTLCESAEVRAGY